MRFHGRQDSNDGRQSEHLECLCEQFRCDDNQATVMQLACEEEWEEQLTKIDPSFRSTMTVNLFALMRYV